MHLRFSPVACIFALLARVSDSVSDTAFNSSFTGTAKNESEVFKRSSPFYFLSEMMDYFYPTSPVKDIVPSPRAKNNYVPPYKPDPGSFPASILTTYFTNCQFLGLVTIYSAQMQADDPITCGNLLCGSDVRCTHFSWMGPLSEHTRGICSIRGAPGTGGNWYSSYLLPSQSVCGFIPERANNLTTTTTTTTTPSTPIPEPTARCSSNCAGVCVGDDIIQTPGYPGAYPPNVYCTFTLTASQPDAEIFLVISRIFFTSAADLFRVYGSDQSLLFAYPGGTLPVRINSIGSMNGFLISSSTGRKKIAKQSQTGLIARYNACRSSNNPRCVPPIPTTPPPLTSTTTSPVPPTGFYAKENNYFRI